MRGGEEDHEAEGGELMKAEGPDGEGDCHPVHDDDQDDDEDVEDCDVALRGEGCER